MQSRNWPDIKNIKIEPANLLDENFPIFVSSEEEEDEDDQEEEGNAEVIDISDDSLLGLGSLEYKTDVPEAVKPADITSSHIVHRLVCDDIVPSRDVTEENARVGPPLAASSPQMLDHATDSDVIHDVIDIIDDDDVNFDDDYFLHNFSFKPELFEDTHDDDLLCVDKDCADIYGPEKVDPKSQADSKLVTPPNSPRSPSKPNLTLSYRVTSSAGFLPTSGLQSSATNLSLSTNWTPVLTLPASESLPQNLNPTLPSCEQLLPSSDLQFGSSQTSNLPLRYHLPSTSNLTFRYDLLPASNLTQSSNTVQFPCLLSQTSNLPLCYNLPPTSNLTVSGQLQQNSNVQLQQSSNVQLQHNSNVQFSSVLSQISNLPLSVSLPHTSTSISPLCEQLPHSSNVQYPSSLSYASNLLTAPQIQNVPFASNLVTSQNVQYSSNLVNTQNLPFSSNLVNAHSNLVTTQNVLFASNLVNSHSSLVSTQNVPFPSNLGTSTQNVPLTSHYVVRDAEAASSLESQVSAVNGPNPPAPQTSSAQPVRPSSKSRRAKLLKAEWIEDEDDDDLMCLGIEESKWPEYNSFSSLFADVKADLAKEKSKLDSAKNKESNFTDGSEKSAENSNVKFAHEEDVDKYFRHSPAKSKSDVAKSDVLAETEIASLDRKADVKSDIVDSKKKEGEGVLLVRPKKLFVCGICEKSFEFATQLKKHVSKYKHKNSARCAACRDGFTTADDLASHIKGQHSERNQKCRQCSASFVTEKDLKRHQAVHGGQKLYRCEICDATFTQSSNLKVHLRSHSQDKPFACKLCPSAFTHSSNLTRHMRSHKDHKPFVCQVCQAAFAVSSQLKTHARIHSQDKPYKCEQCGASFTQSSHLKSHVKTHSGEKNFSCPECDAAFVESSNLRVHLRVHSKIRPYTCPQCSATFTQSASLKRHVSAHSGKNLHKCNCCSATFKQAGHLKSHLLIHSKEKPWLSTKKEDCLSGGGRLEGSCAKILCAGLVV